MKPSKVTNDGQIRTQYTSMMDKIYADIRGLRKLYGIIVIILLL